LLDAIPRHSLPLLVFADDWGRHPSSCQHLVRQLLDHYPILWVNTIGTRKPCFNLATLQRGAEKLRHWFSAPRLSDPLPTNLRVVNPLMWPWFGSTFGRWLNRGLLAHQLAARIGELPESPVAVTTLPVVADLIDVLPVRRWVYYCVDDFSEWPGLDGETLRRMEEKLVRKADSLIAVSSTLQEKLASMGRDAHLLTHGVDLDFWTNPPASASLPSLAGLERPLVIFWGVVDRRMDTAFVRELDGALTRGTIVLAGPQADPDPVLPALPRVVRLGALPFAQLSNLAREAAVLVMPYADMPVTRAMQPLKLKEYLATGKPVVVRDLPATRCWSDCLDLADTPASFAQSVLTRLEQGLSQDQQTARESLIGETWTEKARWFENWVIGPQAVHEPQLVHEGTVS
jgi:glycosyltransferase involved in cell wall biosynthesis